MSKNNGHNGDGYVIDDHDAMRFIWSWIFLAGLNMTFFFPATAIRYLLLRRRGNDVVAALKKSLASIKVE